MFQVDLRSDTVTQPTPEMRDAMSVAEVGDDCYGEDPTVNRLQDLASELLGVEAALFVPTGTMANQIALRVFAKPGAEFVCDERCHLIEHESGATAILSQAQLRGIRAHRGILKPEDVADAMRPPNPFTPDTAGLAIENTHNSAGGTVWTVKEMAAGTKPFRDAQLPVILDGARLFNACEVTGSAPSEFASLSDVVCISLYKGLCAPGGSLVCGSRETIDRAWTWRRIFGGAMRQAGVLAAPGIIALNKMRPRLAVDHELAARLHTKLSAHCDVAAPESNMVLFDASTHGLEPATLLAKLAAQGVGAGMISPTMVRFVTHNDVDEDGIDLAAKSLIGCIS